MPNVLEFTGFANVPLLNSHKASEKKCHWKIKNEQPVKEKLFQKGHHNQCVYFKYVAGISNFTLFFFLFRLQSL